MLELFQGQLVLTLEIPLSPHNGGRLVGFATSSAIRMDAVRVVLVDTELREGLPFLALCTSSLVVTPAIGITIDQPNLSSMKLDSGLGSVGESPQQGFGAFCGIVFSQ